MADYSSHYDSVCGENLLALGDTHTLVSDLNLNVVVLNTCLTSFDNQDENNLYLINKELIEIFDRVDKSKPTFVIGHHGREFLARSEAGKLEDLFNNVVDIYLCGHSHRLGYSTLDNTDNNVIELTCGGGIPDDYSKCSFFYGQFIGSASEVKLTPYSYSEKGNHEWNKDYTLHRKLKENKSFSLNRLVVPIPEYVHERGALVQNYMRVSNARFGFSLEIPNTWGVDHNVADNGDGFKIYCPNNAIEMAAFGSHSISVFGLYDYMELMKKSYPIIKSFAYNNGCLGYAMYSKKEVKFTMFNESIDISYYINFENDLSWFENNDNFISDIARTLSFN
jgi:hypothetical protein